MSQFDNFVTRPDLYITGRHSIMQLSMEFIYCIPVVEEDLVHCYSSQIKAKS